MANAEAEVLRIRLSALFQKSLKKLIYCHRLRCCIIVNAVFSSGPPIPVFIPTLAFSLDLGPSSFFQPPISNLLVEAPPSTASQQDTSDPYRMQRLGTTRMATAETRPSTSSIRETHVSFPSSIQEKDVDVNYTESIQRKRHSSTLANTATLGLTPSMLEQDIRESSMK